MAADKRWSIESATLPSPAYSARTLDPDQLDLSALTLSAPGSPQSASTSRHVSSASSASVLLSSPALSPMGTPHCQTLNVSVTVSFIRSSRLFKLRVKQIVLERHPDGSLQCVRWNDDLQGRLVHSFSYTSVPVPHLEQPFTTESAAPPFTVSFFGEQTVQTAQMCFSTQPRYSFESWSECVEFQQAMLGETLIFIAGISKIKSKGRGEECISQNLRVFKAWNGRKTLSFFANSQRGDAKRYVSVPQYAIEDVERGKPSACRLTLRLRAGASDLLGQLKTLQIEFFDTHDKQQLVSIIE